MKNTVSVKQRRIILFCMLFFFCCLMPASRSHAEGETGEILTVGVPMDRCPVFYEDADTGEIVGIGVDLMRTAAENAGYKTEFKAIREKTLKEALDDPAYDVVMPFGSGYSSLHMLKEVPVDRIKLDLHFLKETGDAKKGQIIVGYMIQMVRALGMSMIVEGVETEEQAAFLKNREAAFI